MLLTDALLESAYSHQHQVHPTKDQDVGLEASDQDGRLQLKDGVMPVGVGCAGA